jgi:ankyrin repeat protein
MGWELGDDLEAEDAGGNRAMHLAAKNGFHDVIMFLLEHGADLNPKNKSRTVGPYGGEQFAIEAQTPLGLVEGTAYQLYFERPATAEFLRKLGAKSEGRYIHSQDNYRAGTGRGGFKAVLQENQQRDQQRSGNR